MRKDILLIIAVLAFSCNDGTVKYDASGTFETDEVIVSAEQNGQLLVFNVHEGDSLYKGEVVGYIDSTNLVLQKQQVQASIQSLSKKTADVQPQVKMLQDQLAVQHSQLEHAISERDRYEKLIKADIGTQQKLDDMNAQVDQLQKQIRVTEQQINVALSNTGTQNRSILSESDPLRKQVAMIDQLITKANIVNPTGGTVLAKYAQEGEMAATGKALYKIADISFLNLRAYITGSQLSQVKLNQPVTVLVDSGQSGYRHYTGNIIWISDKAEFTPKTIQTKDERANLVYAIKVRVKNDGYLKIGMYGEVMLNEAAEEKKQGKQF